jgi:hypothetical protein
VGLRLCLWNAPSGQGTKDFVENQLVSCFTVHQYDPVETCYFLLQSLLLARFLAKGYDRQSEQRNAYFM